MAFINQAVTVLQTLVIALGAGLAVWGVVNLMEGYGNDNPRSEERRVGKECNRPLQHLRNPFQQQLLWLELSENRQGTDVSG